MHPLEPAIVKVWRIKSGIWAGVLVAGIVVWDILNFFDADRLVPFGVWPALALLIGGGFVIWGTHWRYRYWKYVLQEEELLLERGVFNRIRTIVPLKRIQHIDVSQDVFEREFDLGKLIVHTAGTKSSEVVVPGLQIETAEHLRDTMKAFIVDEAL